MSSTVAGLIAGRPRPVTATPDEGLKEVTRRMLDYGFSQLPVVAAGDAKEQVLGMVSHEGIVRACLHVGVPMTSLRVSHALDTRVLEVQATDEVLSLLHRAKEASALVVVDEDRRLLGILTDFDFANWFCLKGVDTRLLANIEEAIVQLIQGAYHAQPAGTLVKLVKDLKLSENEHLRRPIHAIVNECVASRSQNPSALRHEVFEESYRASMSAVFGSNFDQLTLAQYVLLALNDTCWPTYGESLGLDKEILQQMCASAVVLKSKCDKNKLPFTATNREQLVFLQGILDRVLDQIHPEQPGPSPLDAGALATARASASSDASNHDFATLQAYLECIAFTEERLTHGFDQIEQILGAPLAPEARQHRRWWRNGSSSGQATAWRAAGWRVVSTDMTRARVTFGRDFALHDAYLQKFSALSSALLYPRDWRRPESRPEGRPSLKIAVLTGDETATATIMLAFCERARFRIELYLDGEDPQERKALFDHLLEQRESIQTGLGDAPLSWERSDSHAGSRIALYYPGQLRVPLTEEALDRLSRWVKQVFPRFEQTMRRCFEPDPDSSDDDATLDQDEVEEPQ